MTVLVNAEILRRMEQGAIVIDPFNPERLNNGSYDVTLGRYIARLRPKFRPLADVYSEERNPAHVMHLNALKGQEVFVIEDLDDNVNGEMYLGAGERVLAHTHEFIGGRTVHDVHENGRHIDAVSVLPEMRACSTTGRWGITVALCAGWGDVGYINRWTCEVINLNPCPVTIRRGSVIAQILFHDVATPRSGTSYEKIGTYQASADLDELKARWKPTMMLPRPMKLPAFAAVCPADNWTDPEKECG